MSEKRIALLRKTERETRRRVGAELAARASAMIGLAHRPHNYLWVVRGETLNEKIGEVPKITLGKPGPAWMAGLLKSYLAMTFKLPSWHTHAILTYTVDVVRDGADALRVRLVRHLSITLHVPMSTTTPELRLIKDEFVSQTFPPDLINLWFRDRDSVMIAIRAGEPERDNADQTWTPVVTHFYADHQGEIPENSPRLYGATGADEP